MVFFRHPCHRAHTGASKAQVRYWRAYLKTKDALSNLGECMRVYMYVRVYIYMCVCICVCTKIKRGEAR